jgi:hypothetical protein
MLPIHKLSPGIKKALRIRPKIEHITEKIMRVILSQWCIKQTRVEESRARWRRQL